MVRGHARVCLGLLVVVPAASGGSTGGAAPVARIGMNYFDGWADPVSSFHYDGLVRSGVNGQFSQYRPLSGWRDNTLASMRVSLRTAQYGLQSHGRTWDRTPLQTAMFCARRAHRGTHAVHATGSIVRFSASSGAGRPARAAERGRPRRSRSARRRSDRRQRASSHRAALRPRRASSCACRPRPHNRSARSGTSDAASPRHLRPRPANTRLDPHSKRATRRSPRVHDTSSRRHRAFPPLEAPPTRLERARRHSASLAHVSVRSRISLPGGRGWLEAPGRATVTPLRFRERNRIPHGQQSRSRVSP